MVGYQVTDEKLLKPFKSFIESYKKMKIEQIAERGNENEQSSNREGDETIKNID